MSTSTETAEDIEIGYPSSFKVIVFRNETVPMEFYLAILTAIFEKDEQSAVDITRTIFTDGRCPTGVYSKEIATNYMEQANKVSKENGFEIKMVLEEA